jgi:hypothetical protein
MLALFSYFAIGRRHAVGHSIAIAYDLFQLSTIGNKSQAMAGTAMRGFGGTIFPSAMPTKRLVTPTYTRYVRELARG